MLAGLLRPTDGSIMIDGQDLGRMSEAQRTAFRRQKIGFTFQANNLVPYLTALENVELMLRLNGRLDKAGQGAGPRPARAARAGRPAEQPAPAAVRRPAAARGDRPGADPRASVVLADEPTASLDTERAFQVVETFATMIREQNRAGIMVTHDLRMVQYVDRVLQMRDGKLAREITDRDEILAMAVDRPARCARRRRVAAAAGGAGTGGRRIRCPVSA